MSIDIDDEGSNAVRKSGKGNPDNCRRIVASIVPLIPLLVISEPAHAYVGPGAGISLIGALWAVLAAIFFAILGILIWPIRAMLRRRKQDPATDTPVVASDVGGETNGG